MAVPAAHPTKIHQGRRKHTSGMSLCTYANVRNHSPLLVFLLKKGAGKAWNEARYSRRLSKNIMTKSSRPL